MDRLVDTHCHVQEAKFDADRAQVLEEALEKLAWLVVIGDDLPSSRRAVELTRDRIYAAVGIHPYSAKDWSEAMKADLSALAKSDGVKALGEIGLDYFNEFSPRPAQREAFLAQLSLAHDLDLPVVIHNREADEDSYAILKEYAPQLSGVLMHCFGSDAAWAERFVDLGCYVSFAGNLTYPKAQQLREAALMVPLERLLVETDAPYLAPQVRRGKRCLPHYVAHTASVMAEIKGVDFNRLVQQTTANAQAFYRV